MPATLHRTPRIALVAAALAALLAGCGTVDDVSHRITSSITPYRIEVVQGNFVSREQVEALQKGMSRQQVRDVLGTPLVASLFHGDRWDYVFTLKRQGVPSQQRRLTVYFQSDVLDHFEGDTMPSESEFVAALDKRKPHGAIPPLQASEEQLRAAASKVGPSSKAAAPAPEPAAAPAVNYPPLEPPAR